jgi:hypothetical protein
VPPLRRGRLRRALSPGRGVGDRIARAGAGLAVLIACGSGWTAAAPPDSESVARAAELRAQGTVEGRLRALWLLEPLEATHARDPRFLREYCLTLEACHRYARACRMAERLIEVDSTASPGLRLACVRDAVRALLRYDDETYLDESLSQLDLVLAREPGHPAALRLKSFLYAFWAMRDGAAAPRAHREGLACAGRALLVDPEDIAARLLEGAHCHGLGRERARRDQLPQRDPAHGPGGAGSVPPATDRDGARQRRGPGGGLAAPGPASPERRERGPARVLVPPDARRRPLR